MRNAAAGRTAAAAAALAALPPAGLSDATLQQ
jgi:hypothetical protein